MKKINWKETLIALHPVSWILFAMAAFCAMLFAVNPGKAYFLLQGGALAVAGGLFAGWKGGYFRRTSPVSWILCALMLSAGAYELCYPGGTVMGALAALFGAGWLSYISYRAWKRGLFLKTSPVSWILFAVSMLFGAIWLYEPDTNAFLPAGLFGVIWLSYIALRAWKRGWMKNTNPFTVLLALCVAFALVCGVWALSQNTAYYPSGEPINRATRQMQDSLNSLGADATIHDGLFEQFRWAMNNVPCAVILTDRENKVLHVQGDWLNAADYETLRLMTAPGTFEHGDGLCILVSGEGEALSAFYAEDGYLLRESAASSLTIPERTDGADSLTTGAPLIPEVTPMTDTAALPTGFAFPTVSAQPEATALPGDLLSEKDETSADPLYERYFPSFSPILDRYALHMAERSGLRIDAGQDDSPAAVSILDWQGERVVGVSNMPGSTELVNSAEQQVVRALNSLTAEERVRFVSYIGWLKNAISIARNDLHDTHMARALTGKDGATVYILYKESQSLYPLMEQVNRARRLRDDLITAAQLMIPAGIVFLALWVFVDAKKRGQKSPALWAVMTLIGNVVAFIIYLLVRPQMRVGVSGKAAPRGMCPLCGTQLKSDFIACPGCGILLRSRCKSCGRALENDWSFCPYCTSAVAQDGGDDAPAIEESAG